MKKSRRIALPMALFFMCSTILTSFADSGIVVAAEELTEEIYLEETQQVETSKEDYMSLSEYDSLGFGKLDDSSKYDKENDDPLDGYQPQILNELYVGYLNHSDNFKGNFTTAENMSTLSNLDALDPDTMEDTNIGGKTSFGYEETQCANVIGLIPGDLSEEGSEIREQILIDSRLYVDRNSLGLGWFANDSSHHRVKAYALVNGKWTGGEAIDTTLSGSSDWVGTLTIREHGGFNSMTVGDFDGDNYNEVAVHNPTNDGGSIDIYQPKLQSDGTYDLIKDGSYSIKNLTDDGRFNWASGATRPQVTLATTDMAGYDDIVVSVALGYDDHDKTCNPGMVAVISKNGNVNYTKVWGDSMVIGDEAGNETSRYKLQNVTAADLDGNGEEEIVIAGHKNTGYKNNSTRGNIDGADMYLNVLLYDGENYFLAWDDENTKIVPRHPDLHIDNSSGDGDSENDPISLTAGRYFTTQYNDTVFCEGVFLHFTPDTNSDNANTQIIKGSFSQNKSENLTFSNTDEAFIGTVVTGAFVEDQSVVEQTLIVHGHNARSDDECDVNVTWVYGNTGANVLSQKRFDDYIDNANEDDNGTCVVFAPVNVDDDSYYIKYVKRYYGYSNPGIVGVMLSPPYWEELDYTNGKGDTGISLSYGTGSSKTHAGNVGFDANISFGVYGEALGSGASGGIDIDFAANYAHSKMKGTTDTATTSFTSYAGKDMVVLTVVPMLSDCYEVYDAKKELISPLIVNSTYTPAFACTTIDNYNKIVEQFNAESTEEEQLTILDTDEFFIDGYTIGDPGSYPSSIEEIKSLDSAKVHKGTKGNVNVNGDAQIGWSFERVNTTTKTDGLNLSLGIGTTQKYEAGLDVLVADSGAYFSLTSHLTGSYSYTYASTTTEGYTFTGSVVNLPDSAQTGTDANGVPTSNYAFSTNMVLWLYEQRVLTEDEDNEGEYEVVTESIPCIGYITTDMALAPPKKVSDLKVKSTTKNTALLTWSRPEDRIKGNTIASVDSYKLYMSTSLDEEFQPVQENGQDLILDGNTTSYIVSDLDPSTTYYFRIVSISDTNGAGAFSNTAKGVTKADGSPFIIKQPHNLDLKDLYEKPVFTIEALASSEGGNLSYQWQKYNGSVWQNISGATDVSYNPALDATTNPEGTFCPLEEDGSVEFEIAWEWYNKLHETEYRCIVTETQSDGSKVSVESQDAMLRMCNFNFNDLTTRIEVKLKVSVFPSVNIFSNTEAEGNDVTIQLNTGSPTTPIEANLAIIDAATGKFVEGFPQSHTLQYLNGSSVNLNTLTEGTYYILANFEGSDKYLPATSNIATLYITPGKTICYELNGGTNNESNPTGVSIASESTWIYPATKEGMEFTGWYYDEALTNPVKKEASFDCYIIYPNQHEASEIVLYAGWKKDECKVTYELNGGTNGNNPSTIRTSQTIHLEDATRTGYDFEGWYLDADFTTPCDSISGAEEKDITVYAKWSAPIEYRIQYVLNDGVNAESNPNTYTIESEEIIFAEPTREGYIFEGWYTDANYRTAVSSISKGSTGDMTVYAKWSMTPKLDDEDGDGIYEISCYEDLVAMAEMIQLMPEIYAAASYEQTNNINCMLQPWNLEIGTEGIPFEGTYEGNDYYILGLHPSAYVSGVFGVIGTDGVVSNISVIDFDYTEQAEMASGLAGINRGTIIGCRSGVNLTSAAEIFLYGSNTSVMISSLDSDIFATDVAGGLTAINEGTILNSHSSANVTIQEKTDTNADESSIAGGIAAMNLGTIKNVYQTGVISGADTAGGIVGGNDGVIQYGYNNTELEATTMESVVGSIVGQSNNTDINDFWYADTMSKACGNLENSELGVTSMALDDMSDATFADMLNATIEGQDLAVWTQSDTKNEGYPKLESSIVIQRTITSTRGNVSISGRIHPDATLKLVKLTNGDVEYKSLQEALKSGKFEEGWKLALVYEDGTYAIWEGDLTIKIKQETVEQLKELSVVYYDVNGEHIFPNVTIEDDTLVIKVDEIGSFAVVRADDINKETVEDKCDKDTADTMNTTNTNTINTIDEINKTSSNKTSSTSSEGINTGDSINLLPYVGLLLLSIISLGVVMNKKKRGKTNE